MLPKIWLKQDPPVVTATGTTMTPTPVTTSGSIRSTSTDGSRCTEGTVDSGINVKT